MREGHKQKVSLLSSQHITCPASPLTAASTSSSLVKQNEVWGQNEALRRTKSIKGNMFYLLKSIVKRIYYVYKMSVFHQRNCIHTEKRKHYREKINHELYKPTQMLESNFCFAVIRSRLPSSPPLFHSSSLVLPVKLLSREQHELPGN